MKTCLIIDDSSVIRKVARAILTEFDYLVFEAQDAVQGLELCEQQHPDIILLDWHLPTMSALDFLAQLRSTSADRLPHVIYCTTENDPDLIARAMKAGASDYLIKPFDRGSLLTLLPKISSAA